MSRPSATAVVLTFAAATACESHPQSARASLAIGNLRSVGAKLEEYYSSCGGYPSELQKLAPPSGTERTSCESLGVVGVGEDIYPIVVAQQPGPAGPYHWEYTPEGEAGSRAGMTVYPRFHLRATSVAKESEWSFLADESGHIRGARGRQPTVADEPLR